MTIYKGGDEEALVFPVDTEVEREQRGYDVLTDDLIKCADCDKKLVSILKVKEDESQKKVIKATCPCGGSSFLYEVTGQTYFNPFEGNSIGDMPTDIIDGVMHITIEVLK